jgi:energy-coupling factor transporter ATP-binding protein EcfA2
MGARIGEIEEMCGSLQETATQPDAEGTRAFREEWVRKADLLCELAAEDETKSYMLSAGEKYRRAAVYLITAERMLVHDEPGRVVLYRRSLDTFDMAIALRGDNCERVLIPYGGAHLPGCS